MDDGSTATFLNGYLLADGENLLLEGDLQHNDTYEAGCLFFYHLPSESLSKVSLPVDFVSQPHLSPDGEKLVMIWNNKIYMANRDGNYFKLFVHEDGCFSDPRWSPDGKTILYWHEAEVWTIDASGDENTITCVTCSSELGRHDFPLWDRDGETILFLQNESLYTIRPDGTGLTRIFSSATGKYMSRLCVWFWP
jgi:Tol biopolymer transport system component